MSLTNKRRNRAELTPCSRLRKQMKESESQVSDTKSALFDLIADIRTKLPTDDQLRKEYDALVKEMVLLGNSGSGGGRRR
eukprot:CAMPEP_0170470468 /NCGR_PEP_ID=MMETSP0123-20130129/12919_1 /TAXON_ID=182087 /ORGANISM="Favella ehrenbergii, Strain Fehren 1" /LENGTH=79 /DNA_ID=CAMNT_0010737609 /DNA_START=189 /DNA_END=428 /DNA_ORIENTATION=+